MNNYAVWWLSQDATESLVEIINRFNLPDYILSEFSSRVGRPGRGRLWVHETIDLKEIEWDDTKPLAQVVEKCGGIVILAEDARLVAGLPGFVTDTALNPYSEWSK